MAIEKMVEGRLRKYFEDVVLMEQKFIINDTINVKVCEVSLYYLKIWNLILRKWTLNSDNIMGKIKTNIYFLIK